MRGDVKVNSGSPSNRAASYRIARMEPQFKHPPRSILMRACRFPARPLPTLGQDVPIAWLASRIDAGPTD